MTDTQAVHAPPNTETEPCGDLSIRTLAMPADTNQNGDIFGGWLLGQMDIGGGIFASKVAKSRTVTVRLEAWVIRRKETNSILVTDGHFTYVSIDEHGQPQEIKRDATPISA